MLCAKFGWNWPRDSWVKISNPVILEKKISLFFTILLIYFRYCAIISPWKRMGSFIWRKLESSSPKDAVSSNVEISPVVLEKILKFRQYTFAISLSSSLWAKFGWQLPSDSGEEDFFFKFLTVFSLFRYHLPLEKEQGPLSDQTRISFTQGCFVLSLVEIGSVVLEKIFKFCRYIFILSLLSPLIKERGPSFDRTDSPSSKNALCQFWLKLAQWFRRRRQKCEKFTTTRPTTTTTTTDNGQIVVRKACGSGELNISCIPI